MAIFHQHTWREEARRFMPPNAGLVNVKLKYSGPAGALDRVVWGVTVVELRCAACGDLKFVEIKGDARKP